MLFTLASFTWKTKSILVTRGIFNTFLQNDGASDLVVSYALVKSLNNSKMACIQP